MRRKRLPKKNHKSNQYSRFRALSVALNLICIQQLSLFESKDDGTRQVSLNALINSQSRLKFLPLLQEAMKDPSANIRVTAVQGLQNLGLGAKEAVPLP